MKGFLKAGLKQQSGDVNVNRLNLIKNGYGNLNVLEKIKYFDIQP